MRDESEDQRQQSQAPMPPGHGTSLHTPRAVTDASQADNERKKRSDRREFREWLMLIAEILTLAAVVGYACIAYRQWGEMIRSNDETARSNKLSQRAWVTVPSIGKKKIEPGKLDPEMRIKNVGRIPAVEVSGMLVIGIVPVTQAMLSHKLEGDVPAFSTSIIAPGDEYPVAPVGNELLDVSPTVARDISAGKTTIIVFGRLKYTDPIHTQGSTEFCFVYAKPSGSFHACRSGNSIQ